MHKLQQYYVGGGKETKEVTVAGINFKIIKLPAFDAVKLQMKMAKMAVPFLKTVKMENKKLDFDLKDFDFDDEKTAVFLKEVVEMAQTQGRMVLFDEDMSSFEMPFLLAFEFLKFNFSDFFTNSPLFKKVVEATTEVDGLNLKEMMSNKQ